MTSSRRVTVASGLATRTILAIAVDLVKMAGNIIFLFALVRHTPPAVAAGFIGVSAVASILRPASGLGFDLLFPREAVRAGSVPIAARRTRFLLITGSLGATVVGVLVSLVIGRDSDLAVRLTLLIAELLFASSIDAFVTALRAVSSMIEATIVGFASGAQRLVAASCFAARLIGVRAFVVALFVGQGVIALGVGWRYFRGRKSPMEPGATRAMLAQGASLSAAQTSSSVLNDADKAVMSASRHTAEVGPYTLAYRVATVPAIVTQVLAATSYGRFLAAAATSTHELHAAYRRGLVQFGGWGISLGVAQLGIVTVASRLGFHIVPSLRMFIALTGAPVTKALQYPILSSLSALGLNHERAISAAIAAVAAAALLILLVPRFGWVGAVVSTYAGDLIMITAGALLLRHRLGIAVHGTAGE